MNEQRDTLLESLDRSIAVMASIRTPDSVGTAAFDTLKQARAMIARAFAGEQRAALHATEEAAELASAG